MARALDEADLLELIDALAPGGWRSGEELAAQAGVTRAALAKRVGHLRDWGLEVEAEPGRGYRLAQPLQRLDADRIRALLPVDRPLRGLDVQPRTDSTNQRLLEADAGADPQALFAELQTAGRGRRGRQWRSPFGANLYLSLAWSFPAWPPQLSALSLAVGVACARALRAVGLREAMLKWPNDLRVGEHKLGGILIEQRGEAGGACRVVIGIGLNVAMTAAQAGELGQPWVSLNDALAAHGREAPERSALAAALLGELLGALEQFQHEGFAPFLPDWTTLDLTANQPVRIEGGGEPLHGIARGVDAQGALIVEAQGRRQHVHSGEVSLRLGGAP
jgi:BirA family biotin operon repressor/biotin-[acetyl-CoA-carboxylase] ligase